MKGLCSQTVYLQFLFIQSLSALISAA
jgi:hypothetical protein